MGFERGGEGGQSLVSPLTCIVALTTLSHYSGGYAAVATQLRDSEPEAWKTVNDDHGSL